MDRGMALDGRNIACYVVSKTLGLCMGYFAFDAFSKNRESLVAMGGRFSSETGDLNLEIPSVGSLQSASFGWPSDLFGAQSSIESLLMGDKEDQE